ncbi:deoxynucleoside kinase [Priestia megaterium]
MTIFITEGCDGVGKTTLAEALSAKLYMPILKGSSFEASTSGNEVLFNSFMKFVNMDDIIIDRYTYSNLVYATLYKDYSIITYEQLEHIEELIKDKAVLVYLHTDAEVIKSRINSRGDDYVKVDMVESILNEYDKVLSKSNLFKMKFDTNKLTTDQIVKKLAGLHECRS